MGATRIRWAAIGAAIAISLGAGGVGIANAVKGSSERAVYTAIEPCRLLDTRPNQGIGGRKTPLRPGETYQLTAHGNNGGCTGIPNDTVALELNVTGLLNTVATDFVIWDGRGTPPNASQLNLAVGAPPTPNSVTTELNGARFAIRNKFGNSHVIIDVVGIYQDHNHDDRYYTKSQTDQRIATGGVDAYTKSQTNGLLADKADVGDAYTKSQTNGLLADKADVGDSYTKAEIDDVRTITRTYLGTDASTVDLDLMQLVGGECASIDYSSGEGRLILGLDVPVGSTVTDVEAHVFDGPADIEYSLTLLRNTVLLETLSGLDREVIAPVVDGGIGTTGGKSINMNPFMPEPISTGEVLSLEWSTQNPVSAGNENALCAVSINYDLPSP